MRARKPHIGGIFYPKFRVPHLNPWLCFLHHFCACPSALQGWLFAHVISQHLLAGRANNCTANKNSRGNKNTASQGISRCNLLNSICLPAPPEWWGGGVTLYVCARVGRVIYGIKGRKGEWTGAKFLGTFGHGVLQCHLVRKVKTSENKLQLFGWAEEMKRKVQNLQF